MAQTLAVGDDTGAVGSFTLSRLVPGLMGESLSTEHPAGSPSLQLH